MFVLGAGFSYDAGFPLAKELLGSVFGRADAAYKDELSTTLKRLYPKIQAAATPAEMVTGISLVDVEDFMSLLDVSILYASRLPTPDMSETSLKGFRRKFVRALGDLLESCEAPPADRAVRYAYIDRFVSRLTPQDTVITFNWDVLVEQSIRRHFGTLYYGLGRRTSDMRTVIKLHGSIDWYKKDHVATAAVGRCQEIHRAVVWVPPERQSIKERLTDPTTPPFIVPPTLFKRFDGDDGASDLEELWAAAYTQLDRASEVYFCGYRLPQADMLSRTLFRSSLQSNATRRSASGRSPLRVTVVNPSAEALETIRSNIFADAVLEEKRFAESTLAT